MSLRHYFKTATHGIIANKGRAALTVLGIVVGIAAIMLMMSLGRGAENLILGEIGGLGGEMIAIRPGKEPSGPADFGQTLFADSLKDRDVELLRRKANVPELADVMPILMVPGSVSKDGDSFRADVFGGSAEFFANLFNVFPEEGELFTEADIRSRASVAVIGADVAKELFNGASAVGGRITIKGRKFRVVGVFPKKGQVAFMNFDKAAIIPYTTARDYLLGINHYHEILTRAASTAAVARTVRDIEATLREAHGITDPEKDDFFVVTQEALVSQIKTIIGTLTMFLSSVVAIALVVGGIGIMNIMLVSVTERTREIGLRKALGATEKNILLQFLFEAVLLTAAGGVIGIALGSALSFLIAWVLRAVMELNWNFAFPLSGALLALGVSAAVGLVFGLYPARKAAKKSPIEALRYE
ncbi:MAG: ABC transporter permease [Parcubacteria group bacterium]|nr:ABC transporter permease [Parcubacteria group bacterium]